MFDKKGPVDKMFDKKGPLPYSVKQGRRIRMCMACSGQFLASEPMLNRILYTQFIWIHVLFFSCSLHKSVYRQESFHQRNAIHGIAPTYIQNLVSFKSQGTYNLRSSGGILLAPPTFGTKVTLGHSPSRWLRPSYGMLYRVSFAIYSKLAYF